MNKLIKLVIKLCFLQISYSIIKYLMEGQVKFQMEDEIKFEKQESRHHYQRYYLQNVFEDSAQINEPEDELIQELKIQNQKLRRQLIAKQKECENNNQIIQKLTNKNKEQQNRIDNLSKNLDKIQKFISKFMGKQQPKKKQKPKQIISKEDKAVQDLQNSKVSINSYSNQLNLSLRLDLNSSINNSYYPKKGINSTYNELNKKIGNKSEWTKMQSYKRQKLMSTSTVSDILKYQQCFGKNRK